MLPVVTSETAVAALTAFAKANSIADSGYRLYPRSFTFSIMMEPIELNRAALIAIAKQPFFDWLHTADPTSNDISLSEVNEEPTVYLAPAFESSGEFKRWLERNCERIFEEQLSRWWTDQRIMAS